MHESSPQPSFRLRVLKHVSEPFPCSYLAGREAIHEILIPIVDHSYQPEPLSGRPQPDDFTINTAFVDSDIYFKLLNRNFRRSGRFFYRPDCTGCSECRQLRIASEDFRPDRTQRRIARSNADLQISVAPPRLDDSARDLYHLYYDARHHESPDSDAAAIDESLYDSCIPTLEFRYTLAGRLIMVGIADIGESQGPTGFVSAVYCFFDPGFPRRSLGTFNILTLIAHARAHGLRHVYLGYYIRECRKMNYKARFRPACTLDYADDWVAAPSFP